MSDAFAWAVEEILRHEGGFVNDPNDPGGATNLGISLRFALTIGDLDKDGRPDLDVDGDGDVDVHDIRALPRVKAIALYREHFWLPARCDAMPAPLAIAVFDSAVNQGRGPAITMLQEALGVKPDGQPGPVTLGALAARESRALLADYCARRGVRYGGLVGFMHYGRGWMRRLFLIHQVALTGAPKEIP